MPPGIRTSEKGNDVSVNEGGGNIGNNGEGNKNATGNVNEVIYVEVFQWGNIDQGRENKEEYEETGRWELVPEEVVYSDGLGSDVQSSGGKEMRQDTNNNDHMGKVAIVEEFMSLDGGIIDDPGENEICIVNVQLIPIEDRLLVRDVVRGLAIMNRRLYVAFRGSPFLDVYSIEMSSEYARFVRGRVIHVKHLIDPWDLAAGLNNVLYVSESYGNLIHRIQLPKEHQTKWHVNGSRMTLSVHASGNLFVSCSSDTIFEYTPSGGFVREIVINRRKSVLWFDRQVCGLKHAVPLVDGTFLVCMNSRVCLVDKTGEIVHASEEEDQVNLPCYLSSSGKDFTVVAGSYNDRIVRMDMSSQFVTTTVSRHIRLERPRRVVTCGGGVVFVSEEGKRSITIHQFT